MAAVQNLRLDYKDGKRMEWLHVIEPGKWY